MNDHVHIRLYRTATSWQWSVNNDDDCSDFVYGGASDYVKACADALAAYEALISARRSLT